MAASFPMDAGHLLRDFLPPPPKLGYRVQAVCSRRGTRLDLVSTPTQVFVFPEPSKQLYSLERLSFSQQMLTDKAFLQQLLTALARAWFALRDGLRAGGYLRDSILHIRPYRPHHAIEEDDFSVSVSDDFLNIFFQDRGAVEEVYCERKETRGNGVLRPDSDTSCNEAWLPTHTKKAFFRLLANLNGRRLLLDEPLEGDWVAMGDFVILPSSSSAAAVSKTFASNVLGIGRTPLGKGHLSPPIPEDRRHVVSATSSSSSAARSKRAARPPPSSEEGYYDSFDEWRQEMPGQPLAEDTWVQKGEVRRPPPPPAAPARRTWQLRSRS